MRSWPGTACFNRAIISCIAFMPGHAPWGLSQAPQRSPCSN
jgi:hypothetical protein